MQRVQLYFLANLTYVCVYEAAHSNGERIANFNTSVHTVCFQCAANLVVYSS